MMGWYKKAASDILRTNEARMHGWHKELGRHLIADDADGNFAMIRAIPVLYGSNSYIEMQLDATMKGQVPKSSELMSMLQGAIEATGLVRQKFVDDLYDPMEAQLPAGSYKPSRIFAILGPVNEEALEDAVNAMSSRWLEMGKKMADHELIKYYSISDVALRTIRSGKSNSVLVEEQGLQSEDSVNMQTFLCRLERFGEYEPELKKWLEDIYEGVKWSWSSIHGNEYEPHEPTREECMRQIDDDWIARYGDWFDHPERDIYEMICGGSKKPDENAIQLAREIPEDAMSRNGLGVFFEWVFGREEEGFLRTWVRSSLRTMEKGSLRNNILSHPWAIGVIRKSHPDIAKSIEDALK